MLTFLSVELLNGKRLHELLLLEAMLDRTAVSVDEFRAVLLQQGCTLDDGTIRSVESVLDLSFFIASERAKYGERPLVEKRGDAYFVSDWLHSMLSQDGLFSMYFRDAVRTGIFVGRNRYDWRSALTVGEKYTRKDACRLLNWASNCSSTVYGYKVDAATGTCPLFITLHKDEGISDSTRYEDSFINESMIHWFSKSNRTLSSRELVPILGNTVELHVFVKKDDSEGADFFYLGPAKSSNPKQQKMRSEGKENVVTMTLMTDSPVELALYDYLSGAAD